MAIDDRLSDLLVDWEQSQRDGRETTPEELCKDAPDLLPVVRESIDSLKATRWMFRPEPSEPADERRDPSRAALHDTELPASHLTVEQFAASIFQSGLLSADEIAELNQRLAASDLPGEAREIASRLVTEGKLTRYQASVLLKASKDPLLVDNYVILDTLDTGGMGLVFKALHRSMNRVVALKLLPAAMMSARDTVKRFQREVQAAASLSHPNIVAAYDADESAEIAYLVLEYVEGANLFRLVKEQGPLPVARACNYVRQAATGLAYLHSRGIIHRDVKPANLILANDGTVKLLDMGLVRFASSEDLSSVETDQELTQAGIVIGTVAYMSPEQALDTRSADQRSDIYSLGCTLFFLLTGRSLYHEETGMKTLLAHREQAVPSIREFCEEAPVSLDAVFRTMVAKRPADRLQSMTEIVAALDACLPGLATNSPAAIVPRHALNVRPMPAAWRRGWKRLRSSPLRIALAITVLAGLVTGGAYFAGILIRFKSSKGTTDIYVDDPNATVEVVPGVSAPNAAANAGAAKKEQARHSTELNFRRFEVTPGGEDHLTAPSTADPATMQREIEQRQAKIQALQVENQLLRSEADGLRVRGFGDRSKKEKNLEPRPEGFVTAQPQAWTPNPSVQPPGPPSVDRRVAQWLLSFPGTLIFLQGEPGRAIQSIDNFPAGNRPIEAIFVGLGQKTPIRDQDADVDRLASLSGLKWLSLTSASVTDAFVVRLKRLKGLEGLSLAGADVTDECLSALADMTHLSSLDLSGCVGITDAGLERLALLQSLNSVNRSVQRGDISNWRRLRHFARPLPSLVLDNTQTTEAGLLKLQRALPTCAIYASHILFGVPLPPEPGSADRAWAEWILRNVPRPRIYTDLDPETAIARLQDLPPIEFHIERLGIGPNEYGPTLNAFLLRRLGALSHLRGLQIDQKVEERALGGLAAITSLQSLGLGEGSAGDETLRPLGALTGLTTLMVQGTQITDEGLKSLAPLKALTQLVLDGHSHNLNGKGFEALVRITTLRKLNVSGAAIDDNGVRHIANLAGLEELDLSETWIGSKALAELARLKHLKSLNLRFCRALRSADLAPLVEFPALENLTLSDCRINDEAVATLKKLTKLRFLSLDGTGLSADAVRELERALPQTKVDWPASAGFQAPSNPVRESEASPPLHKQVLSDLQRAPAQSKVPPAQSPANAAGAASNQAKAENPDRQVAQWVLSVAGNAVFIEGSVMAHQRVDELPTGDIRLEGVFVSESSRLRFQDADLDRLSLLPGLHWLALHSPAITDHTVLRLGSLRRLTSLSLAHTGMTDAGLSALTKVGRLASLDLSNTRITDAGLKEIAKIRSLNDRSLTDDGRGGGWFGRRAAPCLILDQTQTTEAGLLKLQEALPNCLISARHVYPGRDYADLSLPPKPGSVDREWANWLLANRELGCRLFADVDPDTGMIFPKDLPPIPFHIQRLEFEVPPIKSRAEACNLNSFLFRRLADLAALKELRIAVAVPASAWPGLTALKSLQKLQIDDGTAGDEAVRAIATLTGLKSLRFRGEKFNDANLRQLTSLKDLAVLDLSGAKELHGAGFESLRALRGLQRVNLASAGIDDDGAAQIATLPALERLGLQATWISGAGLEQLSQLPHFKALNLSRCRRLHSPDLECLVRFPALEQLSLDGCPIDDEALPTLKRLSKLKTLIVTGTHLSPSANAALKKALPQAEVVGPSQPGVNPELEIRGGLVMP